VGITSICRPTSKELTAVNQCRVARPKQSDSDRLDSLVDSLKEPFEAKGRQLKKDLAEIFVPAVNEIQRVYRVIDTSVDHDFGKGITIFNGACKEMEAATLAEYDQLTEAYEQTRVSRIYAGRLAVL
jgi:hypothetical protein